MERKINNTKKLIPTYLLDETQRRIIKENFYYSTKSVLVCGKLINCLEFNEDVFNVLDDVETHYLMEDIYTNQAERKGFSTRLATVAFQCIREMGYINGKSLANIGNSLKVIGRAVALAVVVGLANLDLNSARRLLPLVRAI